MIIRIAQEDPILFLKAIHYAMKPHTQSILCLMLFYMLHKQVFLHIQISLRVFHMAILFFLLHTEHMLYRLQCCLYLVFSYSSYLSWINSEAD